MKIKILALALILVTVFSCNSLKMQKIADAIVNTIIEMDKSNVVLTKERTDGILVFIEIQDYIFLDKESLDVFASIIIVDNYEILDDFESTLLFFNTNIYTDSGVIHGGNYEFKKKDIKKMGLQKNQLYEDFVKYIFRTYKTKDYYASNNALNVLKKITPKFQFRGSFWMVLNDFSKHYKDPNSQITKDFLFFCAVGLDKSSGINPKHLLYFSKKAGYSQEYLDEISNKFPY